MVGIAVATMVFSTAAMKVAMMQAASTGARRTAAGAAASTAAWACALGGGTRLGMALYCLSDRAARAERGPGGTAIYPCSPFVRNLSRSGGFVVRQSVMRQIALRSFTP